MSAGLLSMLKVCLGDVRGAAGVGRRTLGRVVRPIILSILALLGSSIPVICQETREFEALLRLPRLGPGVFPDGTSEIRIWHEIYIAQPKSMVRLRRVADRVTGAVFQAWTDSPDTLQTHPSLVVMPGFSEMMRWHLEGACEEFREARGMGGCRMRLVREPDWRAIWDALEGAGIQALPDEDALPREMRPLVFDGWGFTVQLQIGPQYRSYSYSNPDAGKHPAHTRAAALDSLVWRLLPPSFPPRRRQVVRGRLRIEDGFRTIQPCGSSELWSVNVMFREPYSWPADSAQIRGSYYAELRGIQVLPRLLAAWRHSDSTNRHYANPAMFDADSLVRLAPWEDQCEW